MVSLIILSIYVPVSGWYVEMLQIFSCIAVVSSGIIQINVSTYGWAEW